jgi:hypothetical protein
MKLVDDMKKVLEVENIIKKAKEDNMLILFHSGYAGIDNELIHGVYPEHGEWLQEIANGYDEELFMEIEERSQDNPISFFSEDPSWVAIKAARSINKTLGELTRQELENKGQLCILLVEQEDTDFNRACTTESGDYGKATNLLGDEIVEYELPFGVESGDIYSTANFNPVEITLTGKDLLVFLERNYPKLNQLPTLKNEGSWYHGTINKFNEFDTTDKKYLETKR